jgi:hypothetical protein
LQEHTDHRSAIGEAYTKSRKVASNRRRISRIPRKVGVNTRAFSVLLAEIAAYVTTGVVSCVARDLKPNSAHRIPQWAAQTKLRDAMPPRAILDMKLGGSGSELDGLGHVGVSSFLTRVGQLLRQLWWRALDV